MNIPALYRITAVMPQTTATQWVALLLGVWWCGTHNNDASVIVCMLFENFIVYYLAPIVHGLGSRAFIPQNRVRVPVGVLVALGMTGMVRLHFRLNATAGRVTYYAPLAHQVELPTFNRKVLGSSPRGRTEQVGIAAA